jgi:hypothetical protein
VKELLLKLLTVMLLLLVGMHWQKLFMLGCLIGVLIFTALSRTISLILSRDFWASNVLMILIFLSGLLIRLIGLLGKI